MRIAFTLLLAFAGTSNAQTLHKCTDAAGKVIYQSTACGIDARKAQKITTPEPSSSTDRSGRPVVSDSVVRTCFRGFQLGTKDPSATKLVSHYTRFHVEGYPMVVLDVVMPPVKGSTDRKELWCRLKGDMTINETAMEETWTAFKWKEQYDFEKKPEPVRPAPLKITP